MTCTKPIEINGDLLFPCGKCMSCRVQRTQEWSLRLIDEKSDWDNSIFVTLTYDDENIPDDGRIHKQELQKFLKRLRKSLAPRRIKYYATGEYGEKNGRPHYHLIIFNMAITEKQIIEENWRKGLVYVGTVTINSCRYVASYIQKKLYKHDKSKTEAEVAWGVLPSDHDLFSIQSQGLGKKWAERNESYLAQNQQITHRGVKHSVPRYYVKKLGLDLSKSQDERRKKVDEELRLVKNQNNDIELFDINLLSKVQADKNIIARTGLNEKKL